MKRARNLAATVAVAALAVTGCEWNFQSLDGPGGIGGGTDNVGRENAALLYNANPHVFYWNTSAGSVDHAYWNGQSWAFEVLDGIFGLPGHTNNNVGEHLSAVLYNGRPHLFYADTTDDTLRHAYWNGVAWAFEILDGLGGRPGHTNNDVGTDVSVVLYNGRPHAFYYDDTTKDLRHAYYNGVAWAFETLDGHMNGPNGRQNAPVGEYTSVTLYNLRPHVFYYSGMAGDLRHAYWNGQFWAFETLDGSGGSNGRILRDVGYDTSSVVYNGRPHVFYANGTDDHLRHAYWNGQFWAFETLDNQFPGQTAGRDSAPIVNGPNLRVYHRQPSPGAGNLRESHWNGNSWSHMTLDGEGGPDGRVGGDLGYGIAAVHWEHEPHVFYGSETHDTLRHAWFG